MLRLVLISTLISINIANTRLIKHTKEIDKAEDKALRQTKEIVKETTEKKNTRKAKKIEYSDRRSVILIIN
jgi:hypothetical protein